MEEEKTPAAFAFESTIHEDYALRLNDAQLKSLNLQTGANDIRYSVTTRFQVCGCFQQALLMNLHYTGHNGVLRPHLAVQVVG